MTTPGQIAYATWHGLPLPLAADEWPDGDRMVAKWETVGAAVALAERERLARAWDGCVHEAPGGDLDIGASIRQQRLIDSVEPNV